VLVTDAANVKRAEFFAVPRVIECVIEIRRVAVALETTAIADGIGHAVRANQILRTIGEAAHTAAGRSNIARTSATTRSVLRPAGLGGAIFILAADLTGRAHPRSIGLSQTDHSSDCTANHSFDDTAA